MKDEFKICKLISEISITIQAVHQVILDKTYTYFIFVSILVFYL